MGRHIGFDGLLAVFLCPFVHLVLGVMDVAIKELSMVGIEHDLPDGRARAFWHDAINDAFAFCHPCSGKPHECCSFALNDMLMNMYLV